MRLKVALLLMSVALGAQTAQEMQDPETKTVVPGVPAADGIKELDRRAHELAAGDQFSGGVLLLRADGKVLLREAYGKASRKFGVPNTPDTHYITGSINKMFTAVAILQLVEARELELDGAVIDHLPGALSDNVARPVQTRHLLSHTSGLGDFLFTRKWRVRSGLRIA